MKQALTKIHQKANPKIKAADLALLIKQGLAYEPSFIEAIPFISLFYQLIPPIWMDTFSDPKIMKYLIAQIKPQYISIVLKYSQINPSELKSTVQKRYTRQFLSFQKEISIYKTSEQGKLAEVAQQNTTKLQYLYNYVIRWMNLQVEVNFIIRWLLLVHPTSKSHNDLINMLISQIITAQHQIKWDQLYNLATLKLNGGGNISSLFARMPLSSSQITAKLYPCMLSQNFQIASFIKIMMNFSCPTKVVQIIQCIVKRLAQDKKIKVIEDIFNHFCKPVLLKHMANSIYYMQFDKIMRCLMQISDAKYTFSNQQVTQIMSKLNIYKPKQHLKLMQDIITRYSPESKIKLQNVKESLLHQTKANTQTTQNTNIKLKKKQSLENEKQFIMECQNLIGLPNIGNSCYMNSFIVSLYFCSDFFKAVTQNQFKDKTLMYLRQIFVYLTRKQSENLSKLLYAFKLTLPPEFNNNCQQQDAMDFGRELLSKLISSNPIMSEIFQSKFSQIFRCLDGHIHSKVTSVQNHLILNFPNPQVFASMIKGNQRPQGIMLQQLLKYCFQTVTLENNYTCSKCNKPFKQIQKQTYIAKLPKVLILCISRFAYNLKSKKILDNIIAKQALKIAQQNTKRTYKLVSFLNHMGSTSTSGHYQAYVLNASNQQQQNWINFDDDYVTQITVQNTMQLFNNFNAYDTPYILFYSQIDEVK